jgi:hypothetical protein
MTAIKIVIKSKEFLLLAFLQLTFLPAASYALNCPIGSVQSKHDIVERKSAGGWEGEGLNICNDAGYRIGGNIVISCGNHLHVGGLGVIFLSPSNGNRNSEFIKFESIYRPNSSQYPRWFDPSTFKIFTKSVHASYYRNPQVTSKTYILVDEEVSSIQCKKVQF